MVNLFYQIYLRILNVSTSNFSKSSCYTFPKHNTSYIIFISINQTSLSTIFYFIYIFFLTCECKIDEGTIHAMRVFVNIINIILLSILLHIDRSYIWIYVKTSHISFNLMNKNYLKKKLDKSNKININSWSIGPITTSHPSSSFIYIYIYMRIKYNIYNYIINI